MDRFDEITRVRNAALILAPDGAWPNFHDANVDRLDFWCGDIRPEENVWIGPVIEATLTLEAMEHPYVVVLKFHDCSEVALAGFNHGNEIDDLTFAFEPRGFYLDGVTPLPPHVCVDFRGFGGGSFLRFKCFAVEAAARREIAAP